MDVPIKTSNMKQDVHHFLTAGDLLVLDVLIKHSNEEGLEVLREKMHSLTGNLISKKYDVFLTVKRDDFEMPEKFNKKIFEGSWDEIN